MNNNRVFQYNCVGCIKLKELTYIIENMKTITYETFRKNVDKESFQDVVDSFGVYENDSRNGLTFKNDWHISYEKCKLKNGKIAYLFIHSSIEYIFY
jgi:hypothetical protein